MDVLLQGFYKTAPDFAVPSPADGAPGVDWWWDHLARQAADLGSSGFDAVWLPPALKDAAGSGPRADGFQPFDDYDLGSRRQKGTSATRYGTREQLQRCVAVLRANGLDVILDLVEHARFGDTTPFVFRHPDADGSPGRGRFPKNPGDFVPQATRDAKLGLPGVADLPIGRELAPMNALPLGHVRDGLVAAARWQVRGLGAQGIRIGDADRLSVDFLNALLDDVGLRDVLFLGDLRDPDAATISRWLAEACPTTGRGRAFDFPLKLVLNEMCRDPRRFDMAGLDGAGLSGLSPDVALAFVEDHQTDLVDGLKIVANKALAYAFVLTSEATPSVFYKDYSTDAGCYGMRPAIDNLIWIRRVLASGATVTRFKDAGLFAFERVGGPHLLTALNGNPDAPRTIRLETGFGSGVTLHEYTGAAADVVTAADGSATITVPANRDGRGYVCYSLAGLDRVIEVRGTTVTQRFEAATDLDLPPLAKDRTTDAAILWCRADTAIEAAADIDRAGWRPETAVEVSIDGPDGRPVARSTATGPGSGDLTLAAQAERDGPHVLRVSLTGLPLTLPDPPFASTVTYSAPFELDIPATPATGPAEIGEWSAPVALRNVAVHAHLLPNGLVLYWGRRREPGSSDFDTLNEHECETWLLDPVTGESRPTGNRPTMPDGSPVNLFCSGHAFLPDGRLLVVGGHLFDSQGVNQSCTYDYRTDEWRPDAPMNDGRWYPTAVTLPNGGVLTLSGSHATGALQPPPNGNIPNSIPQIHSEAGWRSLGEFHDGLPLFPRFHVEPRGGRVFMSGPQGQAWILDPDGPGEWTEGAQRVLGLRDYAPAVMYDTGKILFAGGGLDGAQDAPTDQCESIDLFMAAPVWRPTAPMRFRRRQHNAVVLPDGAVLVVGGTQGPGFNDLSIGSPIRAAEAWNPETDAWTLLAEESVDRCYHSTALLLPDGRVLSAGGGEFASSNGVANIPADSHSDAQILSPPYLFRGPRPTLTGVPETIVPGTTFDVVTDRPEAIAVVSIIRLGSTTHSFDQNQRRNALAYTAHDGGLSITAPADNAACPPGHHLLFVVDAAGVPSLGRMLNVTICNEAAASATASAASDSEPPAQAPSPIEQDETTRLAAVRPAVVVGVSPTCPYGLAGCWGGARGALLRLSGVETVLKEADAFTSTATLYLDHDGLPDLARWREEFASTANASYGLRGIEMTLEGAISRDDGGLILAGSGSRPEVRLAPLDPAHKVQWDFATGRSIPVTADEAEAYAAADEAGGVGGRELRVTGPLTFVDDLPTLEVRVVEAPSAGSGG